MSTSFEELRLFLRGIAGKYEDMWIERQALIDTLIAHHAYDLKTLQESLEQAKKEPYYRDLAHKSSAQMWAALDDKTLQTMIEDLMKMPLPPGKPN